MPQFPNEWVVSAPAGDYVITWEKDLASYKNNYVAQGPLSGGGFGAVPPPAWWSSSTYRYKLAHIVYNAQSTDIPSVISTSQIRGNPLLYIYDQPNSHYFQLPSYFEQETCGSWNCGGCCDSTGVCNYPGMANSACGVNGSACQNCTAQGDVCLEINTCTGIWSCADPSCHARQYPQCTEFCP